ncbi:MAG: sigma-70 family RNA polymerase sigma factor [Planctomycetes bacterium]|nr:sigma-70 family RNA polymerase sigma factor [Planctomycetota bacterium]
MSSQSDATSLSLLQRARSNDQDAWDQIVHLYGPLVQRWCKRVGMREDDIADVFQESFHAVSNHLDGFKPAKAVGSFRSWLRTIVRTKIADHFRKVNEQPVGRGGSTDQMRLANVADPLADDCAEDESEENALVVQRAMELIESEFSAKNWQAFKLVALEGYSAVEIAQQLNVQPQAVRQANYRIRRRLRAVLQDLMEPTDSDFE